MLACDMCGARSKDVTMHRMLGGWVPICQRCWKDPGNIFKKLTEEMDR